MTVQYVLVTDTNIWIDLQNGSLIEHVFDLPYRFVAPDLARLELRSVSWDHLASAGLVFMELSPDLISELVRIRGDFPGLSVIDLAAFVLAKDLQATLVSGDRQLTELAKAAEISTHGVLWLLDQIVNLEMIGPVAGALSLRTMIESGARLPREEIRLRLSVWEQD